MRLYRWLIPLPSIVLSLFPLMASAEPVAGVTAYGYTITSAPPIKSDVQYVSCGSETENNINRNFNGEPFQRCGADWFMVHYKGFITIPVNESISFMVAADDGGTVKIGDVEFGTWNNKGCSWSAQTSTSFVANTYALDAWFYEATGLTCFMLAWNIDGQGWQIVPDSAFTSDGETSTIATTSTTLTSTSTTTTFTTSSTSTTSTTVEPNTTTTLIATTSTSIRVQATPTTSSTTQLLTTTTTTTTTPTTTLEPTTTTFYVAPVTTPLVQVVTEPVVEVPTGTIAQPIEAQPIETTSPPTTIELKPKIDMPLTTETRLPETVAPPTSTTDPSVPRPNTTVPPLIVLRGTPLDGADPFLIARDELISQPSSTTTTPNSSLLTPITNLTELGSSGQDTLEKFANQRLIASDSSLTVAEFVGKLGINPIEPIKDEQVAEILATLSTATQVEIQGAMTLILEAGLSNEQTVLFVSAPEILASISGDQAETLFESLHVEELTDAELGAFTAVIQMAPSSVKKAFEKAINVFGSQFESYVPEGSLIPVSKRRALVAVGALLLSVPALPNGTRSRVKS